jgi:hypothetical protein
VNGEDVCPEYSYPFVVSLQLPSEAYGHAYNPTDTSVDATVCGGVVCDRNNIITAAHCVYSDNDYYSLGGLSIEVRFVSQYGEGRCDEAPKWGLRLRCSVAFLSLPLSLSLPLPPSPSLPGCPL